MSNFECGILAAGKGTKQMQVISSNRCFHQTSLAAADALFIIHQHAGQNRVQWQHITVILAHEFDFKYRSCNFLTDNPDITFPLNRISNTFFLGTLGWEPLNNGVTEVWTG